jgi:hypothetical protein
MNALTGYLEKYALISLEKQEKLARLIDGQMVVNVDFDAGRLHFSDGPEFRFQVLGTESDNTLNWLWAWAEEQEDIDTDLLTSSLQMKEWGEKAGIPECTVPAVDLEKADGHIFSLIASEVCAASCYYQDSYDGGASFLLLFGGELEQQPGFDVAGLSRQFSNLTALCEFNHRNAFVSYLQAKGLSFTEQGTAMDLEMESGEHARLEFDSAGSLKTINSRKLPLD